MALDSKQKILIPIIVLAFAFVIWQVYDLFFAGSSGPTTIPQQQTTLPAAPSASSATPVRAISAPEVSSPATTEPTSDLSAFAGDTEDQDEYLGLLREFQIAKLRRQLMDERAAIAASRARIAELDARTKKITGGASIDTRAGIVPKSGLDLVYIDFQNGKWTATISQDGRLEEVQVNDSLNDGTEILGINQDGVLIQQGRAQAYLTFTGLRAAPVSKQQSSQNKKVRLLGSDQAQPKSMQLQPIKPLHTPEPKQPLKIKVITEPKNVMPNIESKQQQLIQPKSVNAASVVKPIEAVKPANIIKHENPIQQSSFTTSEKQTFTPPTIAPKEIADPTVEANAKPKEIPVGKNSLAFILSSKIEKLFSHKELKQNQTNAVEDTLVAQAPATDISQQNVEPTLVKVAGRKTNKNEDLFIERVGSDIVITTSKNITPAKNTLVVNTEAAVPDNIPAPQMQRQMPHLPGMSIAKAQIEKNTDYSVTKDESKLLQAQKNHYTLQIHGTDDLPQLVQYMKENQLERNAAIYRSHYVDSVWYVLVYGDFDSFRDAQDAIKSLPSSLQSQSPWVRSMASIQQAIAMQNIASSHKVAGDERKLS